MKKILICLLFLINTSAVVAKSYTEISPALPTQTGNKIEVVEVFWYACPHCHKFEAYIEDWLKSKPEDVELRRMPGVFSENGIPHAKAYYTAEALGILEKIHSPLFNAIHNQKKNVSDDKVMEKFFVNTGGVDGDEFQQIYRSDEIKNKVRQAWQMGRDYKLTGVPSIIVNGKYMVSGSTAGSFENMLKVLDELIIKERENMSS